MNAFRRNQNDFIIFRDAWAAVVSHNEFLYAILMELYAINFVYKSF